MRARLRLDYDTVTVLLAATVVEYEWTGGATYNWEGPLRDYDQHRGLLMLDDGRRLNVVVDGPFLRWSEAET
jgi:hypothetical protein